MARALSGEFGADDKRYPTARVEFELLAGPSVGSRITYNGRIDARSAPYVEKDLKAAGWKGDSITTLAKDVEASHVEVPIEIQHKQTKDGQRTFAVVRSIGRGAKALAKPTPSDVNEVDDLFRSARTDVNPDDAPF